MQVSYTEDVSLKFARTFVKMYFGNRATIPHGSRVVWHAGVRYVTDQPGCYLIAGSTGLEGVQVIRPADEKARVA